MAQQGAPNLKSQWVAAIIGEAGGGNKQQDEREIVPESLAARG
jgi:hypothetical protein